MNILHLSDLHIGMKVSEEIKLGEKIDEVLNKLEPSLFPEILLITGDFTNTGSPTEFNNVKKIINDFHEYKSLQRIQNYVFVPGNHDFAWKDNGKELDEAERKVNFDNFIKANFQNANVLDDNKKLQEDLDAYMIQHHFGKIEDSNEYFLLIGMNSMQIDCEERSGQGYFSKRQLNVMKQLIAYYKNKNYSIFVMVAFHHHIIPISCVERETLDQSNKFSLTLDARRAIDDFLANEVSFAVHGHQHQPSIITWQDEIKNTDRKLHIISNGSVSATKVQLGDFLKNSFLLYAIRENVLNIYQFSTSEGDRDTFVEDEKYRCSFSLHDAAVKCDVNINGAEPVGLELKKYNPNKDTSNLYYLYLNVVDCHESTSAIEKFTKVYNEEHKNKVIICGLHHLYGKYDILIKYRDDAQNVVYHKKLIEFLQDNKFVYESSIYYFMNVSYEGSCFETCERIPFLNSTEAYLNSTWNMATLKVETGERLRPNTFMHRLESAVNGFNQKYNTKIEDIIRNYAVGQDNAIIFELFISCYQFPMLSRFTNLIEEIIREYGIDKTTHIIYYYDEREL